MVTPFDAKEQSDQPMNEDVRTARTVLASFLQAFARLIAQELRQQLAPEAIPRVEESPRGRRSQRLLTAKEAADYLQVKLSRVYEISHWKGPDGLRCVRIGRQIRFRIKDIESYLDRQTRGGV